MPAGIDENIIAELQLVGRTLKLRTGAGPMTVFGPSVGRAESEKFLQTLDLLKWRSEQI
jgi:hypothetical protein